MPTSIQMESGNLLRVRISGVLDEADLKELQAAAAREIARVGPVKLLFLLEGFEGWERKAAWSDLEFFAAHDADISRIAIVGDEQWREESLAFAGEGLRKGEVRYFSPSERASARAWLAQPDTGAKPR